MSVECPNCGCKRLSWSSWQMTRIPSVGKDIPPAKLILACDFCSETIRTPSLDEAAAVLQKVSALSLQIVEKTR